MAQNGRTEQSLKYRPIVFGALFASTKITMFCKYQLHDNKRRKQQKCDHFPNVSPPLQGSTICMGQALCFKHGCPLEGMQNSLIFIHSSRFCRRHRARRLTRRRHMQNTGKHNTPGSVKYTRDQFSGLAHTPTAHRS